MKNEKKNLDLLYKSKYDEYSNLYFAILIEIYLLLLNWIRV